MSPESGGDKPDAVYRIERQSADGPRYRVLVDGSLRLRTGHADLAARWVATDIDRLVSEHSRDALFVHAGVVGWRGRAIVIPGRTMSGKSVLVAELVRRGATYYSDEFAPLDDAGRVWPYSRPLTLRDDRTPPELGLRDRSEALPVGAIVSTTYQPRAGWQPEELRGVRAVSALIDNAVLARAQAPRLLRTAARIAASGAVGLRGARSDAEGMAAQLLDQVDRLITAQDGGERGRHRAETTVVRAQAAVRDADVRLGNVRAPRVVQIPDVLDEHTHRQLLAYACAREAAFAPSGVLAHDGRGGVDEHVRRSSTLHDLGEFREALLERLRSMLPHVRRELELPWFPVGRVECQMAVHREGGFFDCHIDNGKGVVSGRRLTCVYYFHRQPRKFSGGELRLHDAITRGDDIVAGLEQLVVEPADNMAVFFPSDTFHAVSPVVLRSSEFADSRFSVNVWFWADVDRTVGCQSWSRANVEEGA